MPRKVSNKRTPLGPMKGSGTPVASLEFLSIFMRIQEQESIHMKVTEHSQVMAYRRHGQCDLAIMSRLGRTIRTRTSWHKGYQ
jgi:hypothetical protein